MESLTEYFGPDATAWLTLGRDIFTLLVVGVISVVGARRTFRAVIKPKPYELAVVSDRGLDVGDQEDYTLFRLMGPLRSLKHIWSVLRRSSLRDSVQIDRGGRSTVVHAEGSNKVLGKIRGTKGNWSLSVPVELCADFRAVLSEIEGVALVTEASMRSAVELSTGATLTGPFQREWRACREEARQA